MGLGICNLSIVPVRISDSDKSEMITQLVYGDLFTIVEEKDKWTKIKSEFDNYMGWIDSKQYKRLDENDNIIIDNPTYSSDLVEFIENENKELITISIGSNISNINLLNHKYEGKSISGKQNRDSIVIQHYSICIAHIYGEEKLHLELTVLDSHKWFIK